MIWDTTFLRKTFEVFYRFNSDAQNSLFVFAITASGVILSLSLQQGNPYIAMVNLFIFIVVRCGVIWFRNAYFRERAYMREFIEPQLKLDSKAIAEVNRSGITKIQHFTHTVIGLASVLIFILYSPNDIIALIFCILLFMVVVILDCFYVFGAVPLNKKLEAEFKRLNGKNKSCQDAE